jgi:hypothetical protein
MDRIIVKTTLKIASASVLLVCSALSATAQCDNKSGFARKDCEAQANNAASSNPLAIIDAKAANLTTNFSDAMHMDTLPPTVEPKAFKPLTTLERRDDGAFILKPGIFEAYVQSYTLDASDPNTNKPGGYFPAPIKGRKGSIVAVLLKQVELHPDVPQGDIQQLLLAIIQGTDLAQMTPAIQQTAARVLPKETLSKMQGAAMAQAVEKNLMDMINRRIAKDKGAQQTIGQINSVGNEIRKDTAGMTPPQSFKDAADAAEPVARGTWAQMPGGFYVRYLPEGYAKTRLQVIVPDAADPKNPLTFDPTQYLAVLALALALAPSERIGITLRPAR